MGQWEAIFRRICQYRVRRARVAVAQKILLDRTRLGRDWPAIPNVGERMVGNGSAAEIGLVCPMDHANRSPSSGRPHRYRMDLGLGTGRTSSRPEERVSVPGNFKVERE